MTPEQFHRLEVGDLVRHVAGGEVYIVTGHYGGRVTAVRSVDLTHPAEWEQALWVIQAPPPTPGGQEDDDGQRRTR